MALTQHQIKIYRAMSPREKLALVADFNHSARHLKLSALKTQHPDWSDQRLRQEVRKIFLYASN